MDIQQGTLSAARCRSLLSTGGVGRIIYTRHALPAVVAVRYRVQGSLVLIEADKRSEWPARVSGSVVAFEADESNEHHQIAWSVVVTGQAKRTDCGAELDLGQCVVTGSELAAAG